MIREKNNASKLFSRVIEDGATTSLWFDPWINNKTLVDLLGWHRVAMFTSTNYRVSSVIANNSFIPDKHAETREVQQFIQQVPIDITHHVGH